MPSYDAIVIGTGGVGSAAMFHLADRGARVLGLDRFPGGHDRGSSHGRTRIIRQAYFEHPDYVPLLLRAYRLWQELAERRKQTLYVETGLLQIGAAGGIVVPGVLESARRHGLEVDEMTAAEVEQRCPAFRVPADCCGLLERRAGYLRVEDCVLAHLEEAARLGADLQTGIEVRGWEPDGSGVVVQTDQGLFAAGRLVIAAGAWSSQLLRGLGIPLEVRRKTQHWYGTADPAFRADRGCPAFLYEIPEGIFYGFPQIDDLGVKVAEHTGGAVIQDPLTVNRSLDPADQGRIEQFLTRWLPSISLNPLGHAVCMYTMSPDEHFVVDRHPEFPQVAFAAGLSGHGFKFTAVLGQALADLAVDGQTTLPIGFLGCARFTSPANPRSA